MNKVNMLHPTKFQTAKKYLPHLFIILLIAVVCWPSLSGDFIFDDNSLVKNNPYIRSLHSISSYLAQEDGITDKSDSSHLHTGFYRPLLNFTYFIDYKIWGMEAFGFRLTNIFLHMICCLLIFQLLVYLKIDRLAALFGTLFFALHPTDTESVSMIVCRNNLLVTIFSILALILYLESRRGRKIYLPISAAFFCLALLSKEVSVMMLPVFFLANRFLLTGHRDYGSEIRSYLPFIFLITVYLILRSQVIGAFTSPIASDGFLGRLYFIPYIIAFNFLLIFFPSGLHSFYIRYPQSYCGYEIILSYIFIALLGVTVWKLRRKPLPLFSIAAAIVALFPVMNVIPIASLSIITLRWLYFPLALLSIAIACFFQLLFAHKKIKFISLSIVSIIFLYFAAYSYTLNDTLWKNQRSLLNIEVFQFQNVLFADTLADALHSERKYREAEKLYLSSLKAFPDKAEIYINYAALLIDTRRPAEAKQYLERAEPLTMAVSKRCEWHNNMAVACDHLKQPQCALENSAHAVQNCPNHPGFKTNFEIIKKSYR